jgi:hypothetical protein
MKMLQSALALMMPPLLSMLRTATLNAQPPGRGGSGAEGPKDFRFARLYLLALKGVDISPERINLSAAIESLASRRQKDFCSATAIIR